MLNILAALIISGVAQEWQPRVVISVASQPDLHPKFTLTEMQDAAFRKRLFDEGRFHGFEDRDSGALVIFHETVAGISELRGAINLWQRLSRGKLGGLDPNSYVGQEVRKILEGYYGGFLSPNSEAPYLGLGAAYYVDGRTIPGSRAVMVRRPVELPGHGRLQEDDRVPLPPPVNPGQLLQSAWSVQAIDGVGSRPGIEFSEIMTRGIAALAVKQDALMQEFMRAYRETIQGYVQQDFPGLAPLVGRWVSWNQLPAEFQAFFRMAVLPPMRSGFRSERAFNEWTATNPRVRVMATLSLTARVQTTPDTARSLAVVLAPPWERELPDRP